jgi:hypothetical protein
MVRAKHRGEESQDLPTAGAFYSSYVQECAVLHGAAYI